MLKTHRLVQCALVTATILLAACAPSAAPTVTPTALPTSAPTIVPTAAALQPATAQSVSAATLTAATVVPADASIDDTSLKVGLVTNTGGVNDQAFNQLAWEGIQQAANELGLQAQFIESTQPTDYEANIDQLASEGASVIITVGSHMAEATALKARQYPNIRFAIIDHAYADGGLANITSLMFAEDQMSFLAGVLAGGMSRTAFVCSITSVAPPLGDRYIISFRAGATWQGGENIRGMNNYINIQTTNENMPNFTDPTEGNETARQLIGEGCDVVFAVGANGALLAAQENNVMAIGADVDQYVVYPEAQATLLSSAQKNVDVTVYNYLQTIVDGSVTAGISTGNLQNGGVGLAPFHDWDSRIPADLRAQIQQASDGIINGSITIHLPQ